MKIKEITRIVEFGLIITAIGIFFIGCAGTIQRDRGAVIYQAYPGPALPREQVAFVYSHFPAYSSISCVVTNVDGHLDWLPNPHYPGYPRGVALLPGRHTITFLIEGFESETSANMEIEAEAGKMYGVQLAFLNAEEVSRDRDILFRTKSIKYEGQIQLTITPITNMKQFIKARNFEFRPGKAIFQLNRATVSMVIPKKCGDNDYGLLIKFTNYGIAQEESIRNAKWMINDKQIDRFDAPMQLNAEDRRDGIIWHPGVGQPLPPPLTNPLTLEQAQALANEIMEK